MKTCDYCKQYSDFDGYMVGDKVYCSINCAKKALFCRTCLSKTNDVPEYGLNKFFWDLATSKKEGFEFGPSFSTYDKNACPRCGSVIQRLWLCFFVPIIPFGKYRTLYVKKAGQLNWTVLVRKLKA